MSIVFETDFSNDEKNVKIRDAVNPYAGSKRALVDSGVTNKFLYQSGGDQDPHLMFIDDPVGFSANGSVAMFSGGRRNHTALQGWGGTQGLSEQRMHLNADHHLFTSGWVYMIEEWKVRTTQGSSFRVPVRLVKDGDGNWGWMIHAITNSTDIIDEEYFRFENWDAPVPIAQGFEKASFFQVGDPGKIKILVKPDDGVWTVVFDLNVRTDSPHVAEVRSCQQWYPQMMYPSPSKSAAIADLGGVPQQYYDWWRFSIPGTEPGTNTEPTDPGETTMRLGTYVDETTGEWVLTWDGVESRRGDDHSDVLAAEKAQLESDNADVLGKLQELDHGITTL